MNVGMLIGDMEALCSFNGKSYQLDFKKLAKQNSFTIVVFLGHKFDSNSSHSLEELIKLQEKLQALDAFLLAVTADVNMGTKLKRENPNLWVKLSSSIPMITDNKVRR
ncbi:uncharacterized protein LOC142356772 [Convolutriloba macropyga]|uniref:uncharacterized protein LOC142356772 n=1 Tax=Convolutriloba macropyga TaxID=536237 RepID=UPI003F51D0F3